MKKILIIGAGYAGKAIVSGILEQEEKYEIVGYLDNDKNKIGKKFLGVEVKEKTDNLENFLKKNLIDICIIASTSISKEDIEKIVKILNKYKIEIGIIPNMSQLMLNSNLFRQVKKFEIEDLLGREVVQHNIVEIKKFIENKKVLITGAAGSIGSELVRQVLKYNPSELIMLDINENDLYFLELAEKEKYPNIKMNIEIASIRDKKKINYLIEKYSPEIIFHAAAHKHVPLMERTPEEAIKNNILGTQNVIEASIKNGVKIYHDKGSKIEDFIAIYTETMDRDNAKKFYYFSKDYYEYLKNNLENEIEYFYAVFEKKIIAASIFFFDNKNMHYHLSGSLTDYMKYAPTNLLLYEAANWGKEKGLKNLHLGGGVGIEDGLFNFKKKFNKNGRINFFIGRTIFLEKEYNYLLTKRKEYNNKFDINNEVYIQYRKEEE